MADRLVDLILKNIDKDKLLQVQYERLLVEYTRSLFNVTDSVFDDGYRSLLRYADLLSISELEIHNNLAQQIIILLGQLFPNEEEVAIFKESVYQNVSNFASLEFVKAKNDIIVQHDFLRDVGNYTHQIINRIPDSDKIFFDTQRFALKDISASQYYSFSAPTSMGKTFVIINFIKNKLKENVSENFVIVVPTRALLSEIANKLINELKDYLGANCHKVITTMTAVQQDEKFIAVLTPERLYHSLLKQPEIEFKYLFKRKQKYFDEVLLKPLPNQELLPQKALEKKHKKAIVSTLLQGKTNLIEAGEKYSDRGFTETSYEYATKCLNMLVHDICAKNDSYIVRDFRKDDVLTPQNIIDIRRIFGEIVSKDDDINISALQKYSLYQAVSNTEISYPDNFDYHTCLSFLKKLSQIFNWPIYEKGTLGKGDRLNYYTVILLQWMEGHGLHEIIRGAISHYQEQGGRLVSYDPTYHLEKYNGSANHKNQVINEAMKDIEQIINYKFSMYFLRFSEAIIKIRGEKALINDWYEYVEYGTCNEQVIGLQKHGFLREQALLLTKNPYSAFVAYLDGQLKISSEIFEVSDEDMLETLGTVRINYPEIFVDGESE